MIIKKPWVMGMCMGLNMMVLGNTASPIIGYTGQSNEQEKAFHRVYLKHAQTHDVVPLLRSLCRECDWVVEHGTQSIGLFSEKKQWGGLLPAIRAMDRQQKLLGINVDVIEVSNLQSERYQQVFSQLSKPVAINQAMEGLIQMMVSSGNATILSSPRLMGRSGKRVTLKVGDQVPYQTSLQSGTSIQTSIKYIHSGIELSITPYLHYDDQVDLDIELNYTAVNGYRRESGLEMPIVASRTSKLQIQVSANATIIFAGLLDQSMHDSVEKVPLLGDIPWLGGLFQRTIKKKRSTDLMYKITPHIL